MDVIRSADPDGLIVCLMSGNYVQRGKPAIVDKALRAKAAVMAGADLVLELPITAALSSAEGFAAEGVRILSHFCTHLCFGAETADCHALTEAAKALLSPAFPEALREQLDMGLSFPAARAKALENMGIAAVTKPNDILALEYCKAILSQGSALIPWPIQRGGDYHDESADEENPSATLSADNSLISGIMEEIQRLEKEIVQREESLKAREQGDTATPTDEADSTSAPEAEATDAEFTKS